MPSAGNQKGPGHMAQHLTQNGGNRKKSKAPLVLLTILLVLIVLGSVGFFLVKGGAFNNIGLFQQKNQTDAETTEVVEEEASEKKSMPMTPFTVLLKAGEISSIRLVGDSITAGFGTDGYEDPDASQSTPVIYDDGRGTVHFETTQAAACWANAFRAWAYRNDIYNFVNAGINGYFMKQLAESPRSWLGDGADVIVVALGTNDAGYYGPDEFEGDARRALGSAAEACKLLVVISPVADLRAPESLVASAASYGDILARICNEEGYLFCDDRPYVTPEMFQEDGLHPNSEGSIAIWGALQNTLGIAEIL